VLSVRPKVAELCFQLYGRSLHPELFETHRTRKIERNGYKAKIDITTAGHLVTWQYGGIILTEVATASHHPLPQRRRLMSYRLRGDRNDLMECKGGVRYSMEFQMEHIEPELFWTFQLEMGRSSPEYGLVHTFDSSGRMALGAMTYIDMQSRDRSLVVQAFHTFPDDYAIVKCRSVFELP
jgi:hypothetical protein